MRNAVILAGLLIAGLAQASTLYKWVDKNGVVHYSDRPVPGAVKVDIRDTQSYTPPPKSPPSRTDPPPEESTEVRYRELELYRPKNNETFTNTGNAVTVRLRVDPALRPGHSIWLYLDGKRVDGLPGAGDAFELKEVWRGTHTLTATITDPTGKTLISSPTVTFHVRQTSVLAPRSPAAPPRTGR